MYACELFEPINHFNWPTIDHISTSIDRLKPVLTAGLVNMNFNRLFANLDTHC